MDGRRSYPIESLSVAYFSKEQRARLEAFTAARALVRTGTSEQMRVAKWIVTGEDG